MPAKRRGRIIDALQNALRLGKLRGYVDPALASAQAENARLRASAERAEKLAGERLEALTAVTDRAEWLFKLCQEQGSLSSRTPLPPSVIYARAVVSQPAGETGGGEHG